MQQQVTLPIRNIIPGNNPRTYFDPTEMAELEASIKAQNILQSLLVRPFGNEGKFQLIAGERRLRAAKSVFGDDYEVPVLIKEMTDAEAEAAALIENVQRAQMSPSEEAEAAARVLGICQNDRDEAARRLGWSRETLDKRLALTNLSDKVRTALNERRIKLGHAELLAATTKELQDKALEAILANNVTVEACKEMLARTARSMASAIFDKAQCAGCQHNSDNQAVLFAESVGKGSCTNGACYEAKTEEELVKRRDALVDEYPKVEIVRPGQQYTIIRLRADGDKGVGDAQAKACRACQNFGAVVSATPDKLGQTFKDLCFDTVCNGKKVAERVSAEAEEKKQAEASAAAPAAATTAAGTSSAAASASTKGKTTTKVAAKPKAAKAPEIQDSNRVKEYRVKVWRNIAKAELISQPDKNLSVLIAIGATGNIRHVESLKLSDGLERLSGSKTSGMLSVDKAFDKIVSLDETGRKKMFLAIAASAMERIEESHLVAILQHLSANVARHWKINEEFLTLLTKSEIEVMADEIGFKAALGEKFAKTMAGKKDDIIKALLKIDGFDYTGRVPRSMLYAKHPAISAAHPTSDI